MLDAATDHPALRWIIAAITMVGVVAIAVAHRATPVTAVLLGAVVVALGLLSVIDVAEHRLPNRITYPLALASAVVVLVAGIRADDVVGAIGAIAIGLAFATVLFVLRFGLGDVKLAVSIGTITGWLGWSAVATTMLVTAAAGGARGSGADGLPPPARRLVRLRPVPRPGRRGRHVGRRRLSIVTSAGWTTTVPTTTSSSRG